MSTGATAENIEEGGVMNVRGQSQKTTLSECVVEEPAGCTVTQPIETKQINAISEDLGEGVMRAKFTPATGTEFVTLTLGNCGLLNGGHTVNGVARAEAEGTTTAAFTETSGSELTFFGAKATLTGKSHGVTEEGGQLLAAETP